MEKIAKIAEIAKIGSLKTRIHSAAPSVPNVRSEKIKHTGLNDVISVSSFYTRE
jgi:hypothetical protein